MKKVSGIIVFMLAFLGLVGCGSKTYEIDLKDYVNVVVTGYDGDGVAAVSFMGEEFSNALLKEFGYTNDEFNIALKSADTKEKELQKLVDIRELLLSFYMSVPEAEGKKNGDTVEYTVEYDELTAEKLGLTVNNTSEPYVVNGLEELKLITEEMLKEMVKVTVSGVAPHVNVQAEFTGDIVGLRANYLPEESKITDGGFAAVAVVVYKEELKEQGYRADKDGYVLEFPVEINERYASKPEEIGEELWGSIYKELKDKYVSRYYMGANRSLYNKGRATGGMNLATSLGDPVIKEAYLLNSKTGDWGILNQIVVIFEANYKGKDYYFGDETIDANFFVGAYVSNIVVDKEGKTEGMLLEADVTNGEFDYVTLKNSVVTKHMGDYNVVEIPVENFK